MQILIQTVVLIHQAYTKAITKGEKNQIKACTQDQIMKQF